jgi:ABC-type transport system involved in cytochrome c biogenesis permease subunit
MPETTLLWTALAAYATAFGMAWRRPAGTPTRMPAMPALADPLPWLSAAIVLHTAALAWRWSERGHGPFTTLHEVLSSNLWSLALVVATAAWRVRELRLALAAAAPVLAVLAAWLAFSDAGAGHLPPTYATPLLYVHAVFGKLFLGLLLAALALAAMPWLRTTRWAARAAARWPGDTRFAQLSHRFAGFAFVADSLMLIVGALWARDAWGRYWAWDPLESWAFITWLAFVVALHGRSVVRPAPRTWTLWLALVFVLAFLTFFGVPFVSTAPHKGAV